jgi:predicted amidohydrolase
MAGSQRRPPAGGKGSADSGRRTDRLLVAGAPLGGARSRRGGRDDIGPADWDRADWAGLARELDEMAKLAGQLGLWTVVGGIHRSASEARPGNCLFVISSRGQLTGRYDERMLSKTESALMYTAGRDPLVFTASGVRFGCARRG